jgi:predicted dehydrogenase
LIESTSWSAPTRTSTPPAVAARLVDPVGVMTVPTAAEALGTGVDGVVIASSTASHLELPDAALRVGVPAFCEKPVAADPAAGEHLAAFRAELAGFMDVVVGAPSPCTLA